MSVYSVFKATGDSCGICQGLDGHRVPAGHKPHTGCTCETIVVHEDGDCVWSFEFEGYAPDGSAGVAVTVTCPDGGEISDSVPVQLPAPTHSPGPGDTDPEAEAVIAGAEDHAHELCEECPRDDADAGFRCC